MLSNYIPVVVLIVVAAGIAVGIVAASHILSPRFKSKGKDESYESGIVPRGDARERFNVRFCVVAILFLVFDVEAAFIFPWAIYYRTMLSYRPVWLLIGEIFIFVNILLFGLFYAWKRGGLDWE